MLVLLCNMDKPNTGDNILIKKNISTGCAVVCVWGCVLSNAPPVTNNMRGSPAARGCASEGVC